MTTTSTTQTEDWLYDATVIQVKDGDTVVARVDLGFHVDVVLTFRLLGINTPELHGTSAPAGLAAKEWLVSQIENKRVQIETVRDTTEKYGRYLARIIVNGKDVNQALVEAGHAVPYNGGKRE
jgi:micrococcal nuclease